MQLLIINQSFFFPAKRIIDIARNYARIHDRSFLAGLIQIQIIYTRIRKPGTCMSPQLLLYARGFTVYKDKYRMRSGVLY